MATKTKAMGFLSTEPAADTTSANTTTPESPSDILPEADELQQYLTEHTDRSAEELEEAMTALQDDFQFLTPVSAYYLLGHRLNVDLAEVFETKQRDYSLDIENLQPEMNSVDLTATVDKITPVNTFSRNDGSDGKVCNVILKDATGRTALTLWDEATQYRNDLEKGSTISLEGGYSKPASDFCQSRFDCSVEVRIGDGKLLLKDGDEWTDLS